MLRTVLLIVALFIATPAHACLGYFNEYRPVRHQPIDADVAPVVAKVTVVGPQFGNGVRHYVMFRIKVEQVVTGDLPGEIAMAVRNYTSCDREPMIGESGYVAGEVYEGVFYAASFRMNDGRMGTRPDMRPYLSRKER